MATTPEGKVKESVKRVLRILQAYWHMPVQNGMGSPSLDFHVCVPVTVTPAMVGKTIGLYVAIETKAPGKKPTPRQQLTIGEVEAAHGKVFVTDTDVSGEMTQWLVDLTASPTST